MPMKRKPLPGVFHKNSPSSHPEIKQLRARISRASTEPGVYKWLDKEGTVLYVGKAKNLRNRLRSYVNDKTETFRGPWKQSFLRQIADFQVTVVNNEIESLILETNMIKELRPRYNVMMKDDKNYLFVRISTDHFPRVELVRKLERDGAKYFGPYMSSYEANRMLDLLHEALQYRVCTPSLDILNRDEPNLTNLRPCLDSQIGRCAGLCSGGISNEEYRKRIEDVIDFLKGNHDTVRKALQQRMADAAKERKFEIAARIRDYLQMIEGTFKKQIISDTSGEDRDVIAVAVLSARAHVVVMRQRGGRLIGDMSYSLKGEVESAEEVLENFLPQYYSENIDIPDTIIASHDFPERSVIAEWLTMEKKKKVHVIIPERGHKSKLLELAEKNAQEKARQEEVKWEAELRNTIGALEGLQKWLDLPEPPHRIEGYDISHLGGTETVGSMVVMVGGKAANDQYRNFTIHSMQHGAVDDYRALKEVLHRRLRHLSGGFQREVQKWEETGIKVGKAHKDEAEIIRELSRPADTTDPVPVPPSDAPFEYKDFLVARYEENIVGMVQLYEHPTGLLEVRHLWVAEAYQGGLLTQFLLRSLLRSLKKEKVYICIPPELEASYASVGFRHVLKPPKVFEGVTLLVMMYDPLQHKTDSSLQSPPDLLVIDGGKGQLSAAVEVLKVAELSIPVIGLAKREEEVFVPGKSESLLLPKDEPSLFLLMRLRDEAHRFANRHREKRGLSHAKRSILDTIPSIGPETKKQLLTKFKTIDGIRFAPKEELIEVINEEQYEALKKVL